MDNQKLAGELVGIAKELVADDDLDKHFGPWLKEKSWGIKEKLPVRVKIRKGWSNSYVIEVPKMTMTYETWQHLYQGHRSQDIDVTGSTYDYNDGEAEFRAETVEDIDMWFKKYRRYVKPANSYS